MANRSSRENITIHVLALLLAIVMWSFVKTAEIPGRLEASRIFHNIPLEVRGVPEDMHLANRPPESVSVTVRGASQVLEQLQREQIVAYLDLEQAQEGARYHSLRILVPAGLTATMNPSRAYITLERVLTADFELQIIAEGRPANDKYPVLTAANRFVRVSGPRSQVSRVVGAALQVDLTGIYEDTSLLPMVQLLDAAGRQVTGLLVDPGAVAVNIELLSGKELPVRPVVSGEPAAGYELHSITVEPSSIVIYGPASVLEGLTYLETELVNLEGLTEDTEFTVDLVLPTDIYGAQETTMRVEVTVVEQQEEPR